MADDVVHMPYFGLMDTMKRKGTSQYELAKRLGIDRSTFNLKINRSLGRDFSLSEALSISKILNISIDSFF